MTDTFRSALAAADEVILDGLGETVTITAKGDLVGVLEEETDFDIDMQGTRPVFYYQETDMTVVVGDQLVYASVSYMVRRIETDGMGMGKLILSKD